ncbi:MAG TPA: hypothetical protein DDY98_01125 [Ruminococcaceae bacterium]|nr:hypothetical protein [Oscillospiraceae bacterium]
MSKPIDFFPNLLTFQNGETVQTKEAWSKRRTELLRILSEHEYGITPGVCGETTATVKMVIEKCASGHGILEQIEIAFPTPKGNFSFPIWYFHPNDKNRHITFVCPGFNDDPYNKYLPAEEIIDRGFGVVTFQYEDVTTDNGDFTNGLASHFERRKDGTDWGKIGMWAFACSRVADCLLTRPEVSALGVIGHSRLGKTALWCAAQDERFAFACSNDSGCSGASYERAKHEGAETVRDITAPERFYYWFCENYRQYANRATEMPFDQHFLLALIAPRLLCVGSASLDAWADPYTEQLACIGATPAWKLYGKQGFIGKTEPAISGDVFDKGEIYYHLRNGIHFLGRGDWNGYMNFLQEKKLFSR